MTQEQMRMLLEYIDTRSPDVRKRLIESCHEAPSELALMDDRKRLKRPEQTEVSCYADQIALPAREANRFYDYYASNGWKVGGKPMKDWKAALRNWKRNHEDRTSGTAGDVISARNRLVGTASDRERNGAIAAERQEAYRRMAESEATPFD